MAKYKLNELCKFITDGTHQTPEYCEKEGIIFLSSKDVTERKIDWNNVKYISVSLHEKLCKRLKPQKNDILLAKNGTTGVAAIVDRDEIFDVYVSLAVLRPLDNIYPRYLLYAINSPVAKKQFDAGLKGIGVPNLHLGVIRETVVNIAPRNEQEKICEILDRVENVINERKQELIALENLIKARFVELFGDLMINNKQWGRLKISEICTEIVDCINKTAPTVEYETDYKMLRTTNVKNGEVDINDVKYVEEITFDKWTRRSIPKNGDVLLTREAPMGQVGLLHGVKNDVFLGQRLVSYRCNLTKMDPIFLTYQMMSGYFQDQIEKTGKGSTVKHIPVPDCTEFEVFVPPIEKQKEFATFVHQVNKSKFVSYQN